MRRAALFAVATLAGLSSARAADTCASVTEAMGRARAAVDLPALQGLLGRARAPSAGCSGTEIFCLGRRVALAHVDAAVAASERRESPDKVEALLEAGRAFGQPWQLLATLGEVRLDRARASKTRDAFASAAQSYQQAMTVLADEEESVCREPVPSRQVIAGLHAAMSQAVLLAPATDPIPTRTNKCGGAFLGSIRGFVPVARPVPITFAYKEASLTPEGERAARVLADCVKRESYERVELSGHTDRVGADAYNLDLSARRLATVRGVLKANGFAGEVVTMAKGKSEPFRADDRGKYTQEQLDQLDRRVEIRGGGAK